MSKYLEGMSEYDKGFVDGNRAKKALQAELKSEIEREARIETLQWVLDNLSDKDTDCGEFYMNDSPADDGCSVEEHNRREGRFFYRMETQDLIQDRIKELEKGKSNE